MVWLSAVALLLAGCAPVDGIPVPAPTTAVGSPTGTTPTSTTPPTLSPDPGGSRTRMQVTEPADGATIELVDVEVAHLRGEGQERQLIAGGSFEAGCWQPALTVTPPVSGSATTVDLVGWIVERPDVFCTQAVVVWDVAVPAPGDGPVLVNGVTAT